MFKLIGGEIKKLILRPMIYIISAIFVVLLIGSYFIYSPANRVNTDSKITSVTNKQSVEDMKNAFDANLKVLNNQTITKYSEIINFYKNNTATITEIYNSDSSKASLFLTLDQKFNTYLHTCSYATTNNIDALNTQLKDFKSAVQKISNDFKILTGFKTASGYSVPTVVISDDNYNLIDNVLEEVSAEVLKIDEKIADGTISVADHKTVSSSLEILAPTNKIEAALKNVNDVKFNEKLIDSLNNKFLTELSARQSTLETNLKSATTREQIIDISSQYASNFTCIENLIADNLYLNVIDKFTDGKINKLFLFNKNIYTNNLSQSQTTFKYALNEEIKRNEYVWEKNLNLAAINYNFNSQITMNNKTSALDFAYFAVDFLSFFIILFAVVIASSMIAGEYTNGTIRMLVIRPYSRTKIITAKLLATLIFTIIFVLFAAISTLLIGVSLFGANFSTIVTVFCRKFAFSVNPIFMFLLQLVNILIKAFVFICIGLMISVLFKSNLASVLTSIVLFIFAPIVTLFLPSAAFLTYIPFVNLDIFQFFGAHYFLPSNTNPAISLFTTPILSNNSIFITLTCCVVLIVASLLTSYLVFKKRDI